jgi:hypothetical protein
MKFHRQKDQKIAKSWSKKKTGMFAAIVVLFLIVVAVAMYLLIQPGSTKRTSACSNVNGIAAKDIATLLLNNDVNKLAPIKDEISANKKASNDADCQYILLGYSISVSDPEEAQKKLETIKKLNEDYNPNRLFGESSASIAAYGQDVDFLNEQTAATKNNFFIGDTQDTEEVK